MAQQKGVHLEIASLNLDDGIAIYSQELKREKLECSQRERGGVLFLLSITAMLANIGCLWAHAYGSLNKIRGSTHVW